MNRLKIAAVSQLVFFAAWAIWLAINAGRPSAVFWLETMPVDPRDFLSGNYVQLDYAIEKPEEESCKNFDRWGYKNKKIAVRLVPDKEIRLADGETATAYHAAECYSGTDSYAEKIFASSGEEKSAWIQAKGAHGINRRINGYLSYDNLNRYYMNENDKKLDIRSGRAAVQVQKNKNGSLKIIRLEELAAEK